MKFYDVAIIGAGPAGYMTAYRLVKNKPNLKIAIFEKGNPLEKRVCPIQTGKVKECIHCSTCAVMEGGLGAGAKSDGKYNITNDFGGSLFEKIGYEKSLKLQKEADEINLSFLNGIKPKLFSSTNNEFKSLCLKNNLHLLDYQSKDFLPYMVHLYQELILFLAPFGALAYHHKVLHI